MADAISPLNEASARLIAATISSVERLGVVSE
jgi:hypothetical protein